MRRTITAVFAALAVAGCGAPAEPSEVAAESTTSTEASTTPKPTSNVPAEPELNKAELRYLTALAKAMGEKDVQSLTAYSYVDDGYVVCGRDDEDEYDDFSGPPTLDILIKNMEQQGDVYGAAIRHLCPKYLPLWRKAQGGFEEGTYTVGEDIKPGTYRTTPGRIMKCYWERSTGGGDIIDNQWINNAPNGATVTVRQGEGFTSEGCGNWIRAS